ARAQGKKTTVQIRRVWRHEIASLGLGDHPGDTRVNPYNLLHFPFAGKEGPMSEAWIVAAVRTPLGRAYKGSLRATRPDDLAALVIKEAIGRVPGLDAQEIDDVILGCAMPEAEQGMNVARIAALRAGLPVETSAMTINRFCSSGLQAIALAAE